MNPTWSPDGKSLAYHTNDAGDPIFIADRNGSNPRRIFGAQPGVHSHYPTWSPDGRFIYFVSGIPQTEEMDIWRIPVSQTETAATPERITPHNARVEYPAWLDARTLIYSATAEDGSGQWLYAIDVEHRIPHRVSSGIAEQYLSVAVSEAEPRRVVTTIATPTASLWTVPISGWRSDGRGCDARGSAQHACPWSSLCSRLSGIPFLQGRSERTVEAGRRCGPGALARRRGRGGGSAGHFTRRSVDLLFLPQARDGGPVRHELRTARTFARWWTPLMSAAPPPGPRMATGWPSPPIRETALVCSRSPWAAVSLSSCSTRCPSIRSGRQTAGSSCIPNSRAAGHSK